MNERELKALVDDELRLAQGWTSMLATQRARNLSYYFQGRMGDEQEGSSQVVSSDVSDVVEWILPALVNVFCSADRCFEYQPKSPDKEEVARQASDYIGYIIHDRNNSFVLFYDWFKDALIQKTGIVKSWYDRSECSVREEYKGLTDAEWMMLMSPLAAAPGETIEPVAHEAHPQPDGTMTHDTTIIRTETKGAIRLANVPPEEFVISRRARITPEGIDTSFAAHIVRKTVSELKRLGYSRPQDIQSINYTDQTWSEEKIVRYQVDSELPWDREQGSQGDPSMRDVWIAECDMQVDYDGDGIAEWRKVTVSGDRILDNQMSDGVVFSVWTPILQPHRFFGRCPADLLVDIQQIKTALWRAGLNNAYLANNPRLKILEGDNVNLDDVLTSRVGGLIRCRRMDAVEPLQYPSIGAQVLQMMEYTDQVRSVRTGVMPWTQGLDPNALNKNALTATEVMALTQAATQRIALIARMFAETGLRDLAKRLLKLAVRYQDRREVLKLRGQWVDFDPRTWDEDMNVTVNVGLGTGSKDQAVQYLNMIAQAQRGLIGQGKDYMVSDQNLYNVAAKLCENVGYANAEMFFTNPATLQGQIARQQSMQGGPKDPKIVAITSRAQTEQAKLQEDMAAKQIDAQLQQSRMSTEQQQAAAALQAKLAIAQLEAETRMRIAAQQAETARDVAQVKAQGAVQGMLGDAVLKARSDERQAGIEVAKIETERARIAADLAIQKSEAQNRP